MIGWNLDIFTHNVREIRKVVSLENAVSNARIYDKRMLCERPKCIAREQAYAMQTGLCQVLRVWIAWQKFLENNFADFVDELRVKIGGILLQQHLL